LGLRAGHDNAGSGDSRKKMVLIDTAISCLNDW
jgi:hypothetical protein